MQKQKKQKKKSIEYNQEFIFYLYDEQMQSLIFLHHSTTHWFSYEELDPKNPDLKWFMVTYIENIYSYT